MEHQAWILRNFLAQLERQEAAGEDPPNDIAGEFARLKNQSTKYRADKTYPTKSAEKQDNIKKNRYKDIVPFDHSRVRLTLTTSRNDTDYINASFIKGVSGSRAYIATQGPLPHTLLDFLRMLWEYDVKVVVMACREFELGKKKCERYWAQKPGQPFVCEPFEVYCDSEENKGDYLSRTLRVTYHNCSRTLKHLHYVTWPDHGVPDSIPPILEMLAEMRSSQAHDDIPICIHCSAGCGRTGALCVIDYTWNLLKKQMITPDFNIYDLVQNMRTQRPSLVQTKEQYDLVYRTIKLLFERYLLSTDAQTCRDEVTAAPCVITPDTESELSDLSEELDLLPPFQHLLDEERDVFKQNPALLHSVSENLIASRSKDTQRDQQQWDPLPEIVATTQDLQEGSGTSPPQLEHSSQGVPEVDKRIQGSDGIPALNPPPSTDMAICLMVEDPYFDTAMNSPPAEETPTNSDKHPEQWGDIFSTPSVCLNGQTVEMNTPPSGSVDTDEEAAPPLPQRTPESFVVAEDAEPSDPPETLMLVIPPNAAAEAVRELGGSPPSPVPPLPERTPESFELSVDQAPVEQNLEFTPAVNLNRIGMSSEWFGNSKRAAAAPQNEAKPWARSKSMKAKMTFTAMHNSTSFSPVARPDTTPTLHPNYPPLDSQPPPRPETEESPTPPLPDRTPESFVFPAAEVHTNPPLRPQPVETASHPFPRVGLSCEWDGTSQPKRFLDVVMCRSKSVRAKTSRQEPLTVARQLASPPVVVAEGGSAHVDMNRRSYPTAEASDKSNEKGMSRTRSLKFFRPKHKPKVAPPPPPAQPGNPPPPHAASSSLFNFGFGHRFGKPKGPRSYPETWI